KDSAIISAVTLSDRYISDRFLPDKAVDLVDEAASKIRMEMNSSPIEIDNARRQLLTYEIEREALKKEKDANSKERLSLVSKEIETLKKELKDLNKIWEEEKLLVSNIQSLKEKVNELNIQAEKAQREGDLQISAKLLYGDIPDLERNIDEEYDSIKHNRFLKLEVTTEDIADIVSKWTGVPVSKMLAGEKEKLLHLEDKLRKRVVGQDVALGKVSDVIRMSKIGIVGQDKPIGSFLFIGNTGVGKTELAKTLAEALFDDERALVRIDMSEYIEQHSVAKMIGSPPGYVGYDEGGQLTEKIRRRPYAVILFDEIEKAHPNVLNILLQILDEGRLTDAKGRVVNFKNTIIIMTSNMLEVDLKKYMRPEFMNRVDEILTFNDLDKTVIREIVLNQLKNINLLLTEQHISMQVDDSVVDYLVENGYSLEYGARPIQRIIKRDVLAELSKILLANSEIQIARVTIKNDRIKIIIANEKAAIS
ncbi:MAG: AAA family ATPase, partial [Thermodesulfobacteriota bacterium]